MRSGKLRHLVMLQSPVDTTDAQGGSTKTWVDVDQIWAAIEPLGSRERYYVSQLQVVASHNVTIRHRWGVVNGSRILFGTRSFEVLSITNVDERNEELRLLCVEEIH